MEDNNNKNKNKDNNISINNNESSTEKSSDSDDNNIDIDLFIEKISTKLSIMYQVYLSGKRLYYLSSEGEVIYFVIEICPDTDINPFNEILLLDVQFIPDKKPLLKFKKDCFIPSFRDNRNLFDCFVKKDFIYKNNDLGSIEEIIKEIINSGIKNFLYCIKENSDYNTFIYYGDYELNEIYSINDFLENVDIIKFYRINHLYNKKDIQERYIIITQLYFLIFTPKEDDKSFVELIFKEKLLDINIKYKKEYNNKLKQYIIKINIEEINTPIDSSFEIDFYFIDRSCPVNNEINSEDNNNNNNQIIEQPNEEKQFMEKFKRFKEEIDKKQKEINFSKYNSIIRIYTPLFNIFIKEKKKLKEIEIKNKIINYEKLFQFCEKNFYHYNNLPNKGKEKYKDRIQFHIVALNFLGAELMALYDKEKVNFNFYYNKIKAILEAEEKNQ